MEIELENQIETLYIIIALLLVLLGGLTAFFLRKFLLSENKIPNHIQYFIQEREKRIEELQTNLEEYKGTDQEQQITIEELRAKLSLKEQRALQLGKNSANGGIAEFLGSLGVSIYQKFDIWSMLSSTSKKTFSRWNWV